MRNRLTFSYFIGIFLTFLFLLITPLIVNSQASQAGKLVTVPYSKKEFITTIANEIKPYAKAYGIRPSIIIGQAVLESQSGQTLLASRYHNLFAIESRPGKDGVTLVTNRPLGNHPVSSKVRFIRYKDWEAAIRDYFLTLRSGDIWDKHFYRTLATSEGYKGPAQAIEDYLYSYDKNYSDKLIKTIEENDLTQYDR